MRPELLGEEFGRRQFILSCWDCKRDLAISLFLSFADSYGVQNLYNNITYLYPDANIWVIGKFCNV